MYDDIDFRRARERQGFQVGSEIDAVVFGSDGIRQHHALGGSRMCGNREQQQEDGVPE
jgi:hypothetical protein